ncbi:hypothetical protein EW026_g6965 [Hermanssonia centrifuga]|uniref:Uncharacterized protein n=1 Tax=Hermanssonia centrifuga TaxID=98765 RepID=A0A4V3X9J8_9APHY|nr:hypothetical protein EW026_g6965 [Hermanssonia centrifuga]
MTLHSDPLPPQCVFPKLNMLHLHNIISQDDANKAAYTLIRLFPEVDELRLEEISPGKRCSTATAEVGPITLNTNCQVRRLSLELVAPGLHHQLMYDPSVAGSVREVEVDIEDMDRAHALTALLVSARDRIESLSVDLTPFFLREGYDFGLPDARHMLGVLAPGIKACTAIQKLVLAIGFCRPARDAYNRTVWNFLIGLLSELSATIEHITIKFAMPQDESYDMENPWRPSVKSLRLDWNALRDRLGQLRKLQTLDIMELEGARWYFTSEDEAFIGKKLEGLSCGLTLVRYEKHAM